MTVQESAEGEGWPWKAVSAASDKIATRVSGPWTGNQIIVQLLVSGFF